MTETKYQPSYNVLGNQSDNGLTREPEWNWNGQLHLPQLSPISTQVGGGHYKKMAIQPIEYSMANGLDACQHSIVKYVSRFRDKGGIEDLNKAKHFLDMLIEFESKKP